MGNERRKGDIEERAGDGLRGEKTSGSKHANLFKLLGLVAFIAIMALIVVLIWPTCMRCSSLAELSA